MAACTPEGELSCIMAKTNVTKTTFRGYLLTVAIDIGTSSSCYAYAYNNTSESLGFKINLSVFKPAGVSTPKWYKSVLCKSKLHLFPNFKSNKENVFSEIQ